MKLVKVKLSRREVECRKARLSPGSAKTCIAVSHLLVSWGSMGCDGRPAGLEELAVLRMSQLPILRRNQDQCHLYFCPLGPIRSLVEDRPRPR